MQCVQKELEGRALKELRSLPQIIGADNLTARKLASELFIKLTRNIVNVSSLEAAEIVKLIDNSYRDVQFGLQMKLQICVNILEFQQVKLYHREN